MQVSSAPVVYRTVRPEDADTLTDIVFRAFTEVNLAHGFPSDFNSSEEARQELAVVFGLPFVEGITAEMDGVPIGSGFLWRVGHTIGIGPVTIDPDRQAQGVGRGLMRELLAKCEGAASVRLLQAAFNLRSMSLYTSLGFDVKEPLVCMKGEPPRVTIPGHSVRPATEADVPAASALCERVLGFSRTLELDGAIAQGTAAVVERDGEIVGYTTGVGFYGHTLADGNEGMKALIAAAPEIGGPGLFLPSRNSELFRWALEHGLKVKQPMSLMSIGEYQDPRGAYLPNILF